MKSYEITYLVSPDISEENIKALQQKVNTFVQEEGGLLRSDQNPIKRRLGYPMKTELDGKRMNAYSIALVFDVLPEKLESLKKKIILESEIMRYMISAKAPLSKVHQRQPRIERKVQTAALQEKEEKHTERKVELEEIEKKLDEILGE